MDAATAPTITETYADAYVADMHYVIVAPYRTADRNGAPVEVREFYTNGGLVTAEGWKIKANGERHARTCALMVAIPANVLEALGR